MSAAAKIPVAVIGANGYTGLELVRILLAHPNVRLVEITSRQHAGERLDTVAPSFTASKLVFRELSVTRLAARIKCVFLCLPHHESMETARKFRMHGVKVVDLSADFRFVSAETYEKTYGPHSQKKLLKQASYGLCELFGHDLSKAMLVGVPGCYVTSVLLGLAPLVQNQLIMMDSIVCDSKSGISGAGRGVKPEMMFAERHENFAAYSIGAHRHRPEIEEKLGLLSARDDVRISFTPHLLPVTRGILSTIYAKPLRQWSDDKLTAVFAKFYRKSPFVKVMPAGRPPAIKSVVGTNFCHISAHYDAHAERVIVVSVLDNLLKGASGQAVQCFNLMYGLPETVGLTALATVP